MYEALLLVYDDLQWKNRYRFYYSHYVTCWIEQPVFKYSVNARTLYTVSCSTWLKVHACICLLISVRLKLSLTNHLTTGSASETPLILTPDIWHNPKQLNLPPIFTVYFPQILHDIILQTDLQNCCLPSSVHTKVVYGYFVFPIWPTCQTCT
jgi:hypothetical protein